MFGGIKYHKHLCRDIWQDAEHVNADVRYALIAIAMDYVAYLHYAIGIDISDKDVVDIFIHGSITNYYYDKHSDIDLGIVAKVDGMHNQLIDLKTGVITKALTRNWHTQFTFDINGRDVDLSILDVNKNIYDNCYYKVGPAYSLIKDEWIIRPKRLDKDVITEIKRSGKKRSRELQHEIRGVLRHGGDIYKLLEKIQNGRKESMKVECRQPLTPETVAFKIIRNRGIIRKLLRLSRKQRADKLIHRDN